MTEPVNITDLVQDSEDYSLSDVGMAMFMAERLGDRIRYVTDDARWLWWNESVWEPDTPNDSRLMMAALMAIRLKREQIMGWDDEGDARTNALQVLTRFESLGKLKAMIEICRTVSTVQVRADALDANVNEIVCRNGIVSLDTGNLRDHDPASLCTRMIPYDYDPKAAKESHLLKQYLETFIPEHEDQRFVFAVLGDALRMGNKRRTLPIFWGGTTSGKSQLFGALHRLLGSYICTIGSGVFRANLDDKPRPDLVMAMYTRIAYAQEASKAWALHADQIKRLTGNDTLPYRNLYSGMVNKTPRFTPLLVTNEMPRITNADEALKRRILAIHFNQTVSVEREDPTIRERFIVDEGVMKGLLALLIAGARDPIINEPPERFILATMHAREGLDHVDEFIDWVKDEGWLVKVDDNVAAVRCIRARDLYRVYTNWVKTYADQVDKRDVLGLQQFNRALGQREWMAQESGGKRWVGWTWITPCPMALTIILGVE
jgi:putative DNA primase/helicase